jgi:hypothetical protein
MDPPEKCLPQPLGAPLPLALALLTVALPRAKPTPLPLTPRLRNMGAFLYRELVSQ